MAERIWVVHLATWELRLMRPVDAKEAVRLGDYIYVPAIGGYDPPTPRTQPAQQPREAAA